MLALELKGFCNLNVLMVRWWEELQAEYLQGVLFVKHSGLLFIPSHGSQQQLLDDNRDIHLIKSDLATTISCITKSAFLRHNVPLNFYQSTLLEKRSDLCLGEGGWIY